MTLEKTSLAERILNITDPTDHHASLSDAHYVLTGERISSIDLLTEAEVLRQSSV